MIYQCKSNIWHWDFEKFVHWRQSDPMCDFFFFLTHDQCVVIGLQSTGESRMVEQVDEAGGDLSDFVSTAK